MNAPVQQRLRAAGQAAPALPRVPRRGKGKGPLGVVVACCLGLAAIVGVHYMTRTPTPAAAAQREPDIIATYTLYSSPGAGAAWRLVGTKTLHYPYLKFASMPVPALDAEAGKSGMVREVWQYNFTCDAAHGGCARFKSDRPGQNRTVTVARGPARVQSAVDTGPFKPAGLLTPRLSNGAHVARVVSIHAAGEPPAEVEICGLVPSKPLVTQAERVKFEHRAWLECRR